MEKFKLNINTTYFVLWSLKFSKKKNLNSNEQLCLFTLFMHKGKLNWVKGKDAPHGEFY